MDADVRPRDETPIRSRPSAGASYLAIGVGVAILSSAALSLPRLLLSEAAHPAPATADDGVATVELVQRARTDPTRLTGEQYVRAMRAIERAHQQRRMPPPPSTTATTRDARRAWQRQVELREEALTGVDNPPRGSVHWQLQQDLQRLYADVPER